MPSTAYHLDSACLGQSKVMLRMLAPWRAPSPCRAFPRVSWGWANQQLRLTAFCPWTVTDRLDGVLVNPPFSARSQYLSTRLETWEIGR
jgi:hypothetical protein